MTVGEGLGRFNDGELAGLALLGCHRPTLHDPFEDFRARRRQGGHRGLWESPPEPITKTRLSRVDR